MERDRTVAPRRGHPAVAAVLVFAGSLLVVALIFSVWANRQALDTGSWVSTSDRLLEDPEIQVELAQYISDEFLNSVDLEGVARSDLPAQLRDLPDISPEGLRRETPAEVLKSLNAPRFKGIWSEANRATHEKLMADLDRRDELKGRDGRVTLDLNPIVTGISQELGFDESVTARISPDVARLTVLEGSDVETARESVRATRAALWVFGILVLLFFGAALVLAGTYRRGIVLASGLGLVAAGILSLLLRGAAEPSVADWLADDISARPAVESAWSIGTSQLVTISVWTMIIGAVVAFGAVIAMLWPSDEGPDRFRHYPEA